MYYMFTSLTNILYNHSLILILSKKSSGNMIFISFAAFSLCQ